MSDKPNAMYTLGLELSPALLRGAELSFQKGKPGLVRVFELPIESQSPTVSETQIPVKDSLHEALQKNLIVTCLQGDEVLIRLLEIKLKKEAEIDAVLAFQSEPLLPYPIENAIVDKIKLSEVQDGSLLTVLAARKDHLQHHLEVWQKMKIEPEMVSCSPAALAAFSQHFSTPEASQLVLHMGETSLLCILTYQGKLQAALTINEGTKILSQALERDLAKAPAAVSKDIHTLNFLEISKEEYPQLSSALEHLRLEVIRTVYSLCKQTKGGEITTLLATGEGAVFNNLTQALCQTLNKTLQEPISDPLFNISLPELQKYALPIGAALMGLPNYKQAINFRQSDFVYPYPWKRYKQPISFYLGLCAALAVVFYLMSMAYVSYREDQVRQEYADLLEFMHKPYIEFEREFETKAQGKSLGQTEVLDIKSLTQKDIIERLQYLDKEMQSSPYYYPLMPNVPTVSDVLAWLSTHPNVVAKDPKTGTMKPLLEIENFNYSMVKRPDQTKKQEKYQVKVEIEFSSPTPKLAREFHDALIAPNAFVDPKGEVKWSTNRGFYRASFFLKDKTVYPST
jgi:type IV pilus assembly protein PilM